MPSNLKYGGYVSYPLAPKDIKNISSRLEKYVTPDDLLSLLLGSARDDYGIKIEPTQDEKGSGWKVVLYNLSPIREGDEHSYYISGESDTLLKALVVATYKRDQVGGNIADFISTKLPKTEFR